MSSVVGAVAFLVAAPALGNPVELRPAGSTVPGNDCILLQYGCATPEFAELSIDGGVVSTAILGGAELTSPYQLWRSACFDGEELTPGAHDVEVTATCNGVTGTDTIQINTRQPRLDILSVTQPEFCWEAGETIELDIQLQRSDLVVSVDFSGVDSGYTSGAETVTDQGGGHYVVKYAPQPGNTAADGAHLLDVKVFDPLADIDPVRTHQDAVTVRFVRDISSRLTLGMANPADFDPTPIPVVPEEDAVVVPLNLRVKKRKTTVDDDGLIAGPEGIAEGIVWTWERLDEVAVNLGDVGATGHVSSPIALDVLACGMGGNFCISKIEFPVGIDPAHGSEIEDGDGFSPEVSFSVRGLPGSEAHVLPGGWIVPSQPPDTARIIGRAVYKRVRQVGTEDSSFGGHPQYGRLTTANEQAPVAHALVEIEDGCGNTYFARTHDSGGYFAYVPLECGTDFDYQFTLTTVSRFKHLNIEVLKAGTNNPLNWPIGQPITLSPTSQTVIPTPIVDELVRGALSILQVGVRMQNAIKTAVAGDAMTGDLPRLTYEYDEGFCPSSGTSTLTMDGVVMVCSKINVNPGLENRDDLEEDTLAHETSHWYQLNFMPDLQGNNDNAASPAASDFGEGFGEFLPHLLLPEIHGRYAFDQNGLTTEALLMDYQGVRKADGDGDLTPALPDDVFVTEVDTGNGGWTLRFLWDFFDGIDAEPEANFTRISELGDPDPTIVNYGAGFDLVGSSTNFKDVLVRYLGDKTIAGNLAADPASQFFYDDRGQPGVDMAEFLDGWRCRGHITDDPDFRSLVFTVMDYQSYDDVNAPVAGSCP